MAEFIKLDLCYSIQINFIYFRIQEYRISITKLKIKLIFIPKEQDWGNGENEKHHKMTWERNLERIQAKMESHPHLGK